MADRGEGFLAIGEGCLVGEVAEKILLESEEPRDRAELTAPDLLVIGGEPELVRDEGGESSVDLLAEP